jgi:cyclopropane-fatty-acyl-phospholipid synthase
MSETIAGDQEFVIQNPLEHGVADISLGELSAAKNAKMKKVTRVLLTKVLSRLKAGRITVITPSGDRIVYTAAMSGPEATVALKNWRPVRWLLSKGDLGFAESYMRLDWSSPDLTALLELAAHNMDSLDPALSGASRFRLFRRFLHARAANTRRGSRRNIAAHYDLGNAFYERWLDQGMSYSSALYGDPSQPLEAAQAAKQDRVIERLELSGRETVLEIGCGWGGLAERILQHGARRLTGLTLSVEQLAHARDRLSRAGLGNRADMRLQDYRDASGTFDRIVSIEMLEAVGMEFWPAYFDTLRARLAQGGLAVLQVITIAKPRFETYRNTVDFIQRYIFPGGMLPSDEVVRAEAGRAGFVLKSVENFGGSYALTLAEWRRRFHDAWPAIEKIGFDTRFRQMWDYYLAYCEAGFRTGQLDVGLYTIQRPAEAAPG